MKYYLSLVLQLLFGKQDQPNKQKEEQNNTLEDNKNMTNYTNGICMYITQSLLAARKQK